MQTQNGNKFIINDASFRDAARLTELMAKFAKDKSEAELNDASILFNAEMIDAILGCMKTCTFNDEVINESVFNSKAFRADYVEIAPLVIQHNSEGFFSQKKSGL